MRKSLNTLIAAIALIGTSNTFAASSVDLTVRGLITPTACEPTLGNGGVVETGKISTRDLNADRPTYLPSMKLPLSVTCDATTLMALEAKDNREGSDYNNDLSYFGLGLINGSEKLGGMELRLLEPMADGVPSRMINSGDGGLTWYNGRYLYRDNIVSVANASVDAPLPVQVFTANLEIKPEIAPANGLSLENEVAIDGSVTLTVKYL